MLQVILHISLTQQVKLAEEEVPRQMRAANARHRARAPPLCAAPHTAAELLCAAQL